MRGTFEPTCVSAVGRRAVLGRHAGSLEVAARSGLMPCYGRSAHGAARRNSAAACPQRSMTAHAAFPGRPDTAYAFPPRPGMVEGMTAEAEIGKLYRGKVVTIKEFGAFVEFLPGKDGLVHISELANFRVKKTEDIVKMGDEILVKCLGVDEKGRVRLSRKAAMEEREKEMAPKS